MTHKANELTPVERIDRVTKELAALRAELIVERSRPAPDWLDQRTSPLGPRKHCALVREALERGEPGFARSGRRWLASAEALSAALARQSAAPKPAPEHKGVRAELATLITCPKHGDVMTRARPRAELSCDRCDAEEWANEVTK